MDREILFRGKPKDKDCQMFKNLQIHMQDGFIYGSLIVQDDAYYICTFAIKHSISYINNGIVTMVEVIPETVGQYTGLTDKNGKKIFEGDIIKIPDNYDEFGINAGEVYEVYFAFGGFRLKPKYSKAKGFWLEDDATVEIIGTIHDNPELLEVI